MTITDQPDDRWQQAGNELRYTCLAAEICTTHSHGSDSGFFWVLPRIMDSFQQAFKSKYKIM